MCESSFTVGLFGCYQCNIKHSGKNLAWKTQTRLQPTRCARSPTRTGTLGLRSASAASDGGRGGQHGLPESHIPPPAPVGPSSAGQTSESVLSTSQILPLPGASLLSLDLNCLTCTLPILSSTPSLFPLIPALGLAPCWHKGAQPGHALPRESPHSAPQAWLQICYSVSKIPLGAAEILSSCCLLC